MPPSPGPAAPLSLDRLAERAVGDRPIDVPASPIRITPYNTDWPAGYLAEQTRIRAALGARALAVEHVGSTAVPGLPVREPDWYQHRRLWNEGHTVNLHVFAPDCDEHLRHLIFRDRLRAHPDDQDFYEAAKRRAVEDNRWSVAAYNAQKSAAIIEILRRAGLRPATTDAASPPS